MSRCPHLKSSLICVVALLAATPLRANDFPTVARVEFVLSCMRDSKAAAHEMLYKCSCLVDSIAQRIRYDELVELSTLANAMPIAGERGGALRDLNDGRKRVAGLRRLPVDANKCWLIERSSAHAD